MSSDKNSIVHAKHREVRGQNVPNTEIDMNGEACCSQESNDFGSGESEGYFILDNYPTYWNLRRNVTAIMNL